VNAVLTGGFTGHVALFPGHTAANWQSFCGGLRAAGRQQQR